MFAGGGSGGGVSGFKSVKDDASNGAVNVGGVEEFENVKDDASNDAFDVDATLGGIEGLKGDVSKVGGCVVVVVGGTR